MIPEWLAWDPQGHLGTINLLWERHLFKHTHSLANMQLFSRRWRIHWELLPPEGSRQSFDSWLVISVHFYNCRRRRRSVAFKTAACHSTKLSWRRQHLQGKFKDGSAQNKIPVFHCSHLSAAQQEEAGRFRKHVRIRKSWSRLDSV